MPFLLSFVVEVADTLSRIVFRSFSLSLLLLAASGTIRAQAQDPFTQNRLPDLGMMPESHEGEKHFAEMAKAFGEASMKNNDLDTGEQARQFAFGQVRDVVSEQVNQQLESWLSAWGSASVDINVDNEGHFNGSRGSWFIPLQDKQRYLTWSQLGLTQQTDGLVSNIGVGQRWAQDGWLLGYNTFYDNLLDENLQRAGFGAEAWGEYLRLSANYYQPFADWQTHTATLEQ
ncbi:inverse autotransporter invasin YchO, partial [Salmonella enterica subsp. enterica serovar Derby]|nr:inverse autotransporter invasin YchO [Salmonella enterica subsp. enterica serovar Derby]